MKKHLNFKEENICDKNYYYNQIDQNKEEIPSECIKCNRVIPITSDHIKWHLLYAQIFLSSHGTAHNKIYKFEETILYFI